MAFDIITCHIKIDCSSCLIFSMCLIKMLAKPQQLLFLACGIVEKRPEDGWQYIHFFHLNQVMWVMYKVSNAHFPFVIRVTTSLH